MPRLPLPRFTARELLARCESIASNGFSAIAQVGLELGPETRALRVVDWRYRQQLHEPWSLELQVSSAEPIAGGIQEVPKTTHSLLWQGACFWQRDGAIGLHTLCGRISQIAHTGTSADLFHYRIQVVPALQVLAYTRRSRVFQRSTALQVAQTVLKEHGILPVEVRQAPPLARWRHLSQHRDPAQPELFETDLHFVRRILANEGMTIWFEPDDAGERVVIGRAGQASVPARAEPLPAAALSGLNAPDAQAEHLFGFFHDFRVAPNIARAWGYDYRDRGRAMSAEYEADPKQPRGPSDVPMVYETFVPGLDAISFEGDRLAGVQRWLQLQARLMGQRQQQLRYTLRASCNVAGLWRCGQTLQLVLPDGPEPPKTALWLLTGIEAGSHLGPDLEPPGPYDDDPSPWELGPSQACVHFDASPVVRWIQNGWVPEALPTVQLDLEHARIGATSGSRYAYVDNFGRYQVEFNTDANRHAAIPGATSRPARHLRSHAGPDYGWHLPLHEATEVVVAFHAGHADSPLIAGALHNSSREDLVTGINASRNVLRTWANNKFRMEDKRGQEHIKLGTEAGLSQLNLGNHVDADRVPRGEGVELRTDHWAALRAAQGLLLTTFAGQPRGGLGQGDGGGFAPAHQLYNPGAQDAQGAQAMAEQRGKANSQVGLGELGALKDSAKVVDRTADFTAPILHYASAAHLLHLTPASQQFSANAIVLSAQGSLELASADQIRWYAKEGITWHTEGADPSGAGRGGSRVDVISHGSDEAQALKGKATILAEQDVVMEFHGVHALLSAAGASIELTQAGELNITANTEVISEANSHQLGGALDWGLGTGRVEPPKRISPQGFPADPLSYDESFVLLDPLGVPMPSMPYEITAADTSSHRGETAVDGTTPRVTTPEPTPLKFSLIWTQLIENDPGIQLEDQDVKSNDS